MSRKTGRRFFDTEIAKSTAGSVAGRPQRSRHASMAFTMWNCRVGHTG